MANTTHAQMTRRADTRTVSINAPADTVFEFVSSPENLPLWAVGFCRSIRRDESTPDGWLAATPQGDVPVRIVVNQAVGVIDFHLLAAPGMPTVAHSRVLPNGNGAEYVFTQQQSPGLPDEVFDAQIAALTEELEVLRRIMAARAACPA